MKTSKGIIGIMLKSADNRISYIRDHYFMFGMLFFSIVKFLLVNQLPMGMIINSVYDDLLMVRLGNSLLNGDWLGAYGSNTLVKGFMHPLFLAASNKIGLSYNDSLLLLYIAACIVFCAAMGYVVKKKWALLLLYAVLLFNPASMDSSSFQRIYRSALTPAQVLLIFGSFWGLYFSVCKANKSGIGWSLLAGASLFFFWDTREDSVWILPFVVVATAVSVITFVYKTRKREAVARWHIVYGISIVLLPVIFLKCGNLLVSYENDKHYGIFTVNELNDSNFSEVMKCLYAVKPEEDIRWVSVTREKLQRIYAVSPTLSGIKEILEACMDGWDLSDRTPGDHEVEDGWFFWAFRDAVQQAGYYKSAKDADDFYGKVAKEIRGAIDSGAFESQKTMPSALMPPWRAASAGDYVKAVMESLSFLFQFKDTNAQDWVSDVDGMSDYGVYQEFSGLTRAPIHIKINTGIKRIKGWAFSKWKDEALSVDIMSDSDGAIKSLSLMESGDVAQHARSMGIEGEAMKACRFETAIDSGHDVYVRIYDSYGHEALVYADGTCEGDDAIEYCMDAFGEIAYSSSEGLFSEIQVGRVNSIVKIYQKYNLILGILAAVFYLCLLFLLLIRKGHEIEQIWDQCLVLTSMVASLFVLIIGVSYSHTYSFGAINSLYYSGAYSLILPYEVLAIYFGGAATINAIKNVRRQKM